MKKFKNIIGGILICVGFCACVCETANHTPSFVAMAIGILCIYIASRIIGKED